MKYVVVFFLSNLKYLRMLGLILERKVMYELAFGSFYKVGSHLHSFIFSDVNLLFKIIFQGDAGVKETLQAYFMDCRLSKLSIYVFLQILTCVCVFQILSFV